jgi:heme/copper-type cytochrome/quinol oxidase subunit 3
MRCSTLPASTGLPIFTTGSQSLGWLGILFLMGVLGWCVGTLLYTYFYLRLYSEQWPQGGLPRPDPLVGVALYSAIPLSAVAVAAARHAHRSAFRHRCMLGLAAGIALMAAFLLFHSHHLGALSFAPQTNAYGSIFFVLSWAMDLLVLIGIGVAGTALLRVWLETDHWQLYLALPIQMAAHYAYFAAAVAAVVCATLYLSPTGL